ncbi:SMC family ATPase, partial [Candidatus Bathyarchaeota archaeon]|nr:SMC family ATPase [Candidatus Bathyarchaeota archaeon]
MIESLHVEGFKSHENSDISFCTGLNVFLGEVGAGKTSILEAVSFALFGKYSGGLAQTGLIRRGGKEAEIRLVFSVNSDKYKVERRIYSKKAQKAKLFILNKEEWKSLVDGANSVTKSIEDLLGVDSSTFLAAIYASQGAIKEMLQTQPGKRREQFDKLLGIDVYERLWDTMGESKTLVLKELTEMQDTASGFEVLEEQKKTLSLRIKSDSEEKSLLEAYLKEIRERLKPEEEDLKTLESAKDKAESINERLIENESKIKKTNETIESFKEKLNNALEAERIFLENSKYIKQDEALEKEKIRIEKSLQKKDGIRRL